MPIFRGAPFFKSKGRAEMRCGIVFRIIFFFELHFSISLINLNNESWY